MPPPLKFFDVQGSRRTIRTVKSYCDKCGPMPQCTCGDKAALPIQCHSGRSTFVQRSMFAPSAPERQTFHRRDAIIACLGYTAS